MAPELRSPSLSAPSNGGVPAYELKFLLGDVEARKVEAWARHRLALDPHGDPELGGAYRTTSLYFDTEKLDVYHRTPSYKRRKFRVRRYAGGPWAFLERKSKWGDRVEKRRSVVPEEEVARLTLAMSMMTWPGHWFHRRLLLRRLGPACRIVYERTAFVGTCSETPLRLTLDRCICGVLTSDWSFAPFEGGVPLLQGQVIMELKFRGALPATFKTLVHDMRLSPRTVSKYRLCREAADASLVLREAADA
jgi:hypothetical protein